MLKLTGPEVWRVVPVVTTKVSVSWAGTME